jgi:hypothetical protein
VPIITIIDKDNIMGKKHIKIEQYDQESCKITFPDGASIVQKDHDINNMVKAWMRLEHNRYGKTFKL